MKNFQLKSLEDQCDHIIKILPKYLDEQLTGNKTFEIRKDDRNYEVGDYIMMKEIDPDSEKFTGRFMIVWVSYLLRGSDFLGVEDGYVALATRFKMSGKAIDCGQDD